jgi:hypothetical protein
MGADSIALHGSAEASGLVIHWRAPPSGRESAARMIATLKQHLAMAILDFDRIGYIVAPSPAVAAADQRQVCNCPPALGW